MGRQSAFSATRHDLTQSRRSENVSFLSRRRVHQELSGCNALVGSGDDDLLDEENGWRYQKVKDKLSRPGRRGRAFTLIAPLLTCLLIVVLSRTSAGMFVPLGGTFHPRVKRQESLEVDSKHNSANGSLPIDDEIDEFELPLWLNLTCVICLLTLSGLFSGLNLGLMSLDLNDLKVIMASGTKQEKAYAATIAPVRSKGNFLLCTLLLGNVLVNTTLTALLDDVTGSGSVAVMSATLSIVIFGEILPQAACARHGLCVGAKTIGITYIFMALTSPLSYPIAFLLDWCLGEEIGTVYNREQLVEYIRVTRDHNRLEDNEVGIISGALALRTKVAGDVMTPLDQVYMLPIESKLDYATVAQINSRGFSRIPVYADGDTENIIGLLHARDLALVDPGDGAGLSSVLDYYKHPMVYVYVDTRLDHILQEFKAGKSHIALVKSIQTKPSRNSKLMRVLGEHPPEEHDVKTGRLLDSYEVIQTPKPGVENNFSNSNNDEDDDEGDPYYRLEGIITLEDIIEEILGAEIIDESDVLAMKLRERIRDTAPLSGKKSSTVAAPLPFDLGAKNDPKNHCDACCKCICGRKKVSPPVRIGSDGDLDRKQRAVSADMTAKFMKQKSVESTPTFPARHLTIFSEQKASSIPEAAASSRSPSPVDDQIPLQKLAANVDESPSRNKRKNNLLPFSSRGEDRSEDESESLLSYRNLDHAVQENAIPDSG